MSDNRKRDIFYGVVAVATLIVALVGATLAYFSISAGSAENAVNATAATVSIDYQDGQQVTAQATELIPATLSVVQQAYANSSANFGTENAMKGNICIDSYNKQVCSIYRFSVSSNEARQVSATLNNESNGFTYLSYAVRDVTNGTWLTLDDEGNQFLNLNACDQTTENEVTDCSVTSEGTKTYDTKASNSIFGKTLEDNTTKFLTKEVSATAQVYDVVLFINENDQNQNVDQGKQYLGTIIVDVVDGNSTGKITGKITTEVTP